MRARVMTPILLLAVVAALPGRAPSDDVTTRSVRLNLPTRTTPESIADLPVHTLRIGFHARGAERLLSSSDMDRLAAFIGESDSVVDSLAATGERPKVVALRAEDHFDLVRRMNGGEFDLAFCSSVAFVEQTGPYVAFLQTRRKSDTWNPATRETLRRGVIIARADHPLFAGGAEPSERERRVFLENSPMAIVSTHSAVGYLYPLSRLRRSDIGLKRTPQLIACDSSEEVAKFVVNGLANVGALDAAALDDVLAMIPGDAKADAYVREIARTDPLPTDPIVIRDSLAPSKAPLGRALAGTITQFFRARGNKPFGVTESPEGAYAHVREAFKRLSEQEDAP